MVTLINYINTIFLTILLLIYDPVMFNHHSNCELLFFNVFIGYIYHITIQEVGLQDNTLLEVPRHNTQSDGYKN